MIWLQWTDNKRTWNTTSLMTPSWAVIQQNFTEFQQCLSLLLPLMAQQPCLLFHFLHDLDHCKSFNGSFLYQEELVDFCAPRKCVASSFKMWIRQSISSHKFDEFILAERTYLRKILGRIKRITRPGCQSDLTTCCLWAWASYLTLLNPRFLPVKYSVILSSALNCN